MNVHAGHSSIACQYTKIAKLCIAWIYSVSSNALGMKQARLLQMPPLSLLASAVIRWKAGDKEGRIFRSLTIIRCLLALVIATFKRWWSVRKEPGWFTVTVSMITSFSIPCTMFLLGLYRWKFGLLSILVLHLSIAMGTIQNPHLTNLGG